MDHCEELQCLAFNQQAARRDVVLGATAQGVMLALSTALALAGGMPGRARYA